MSLKPTKPFASANVGSVRVAAWKHVNDRGEYDSVSVNKNVLADPRATDPKDRWKRSTLFYPHELPALIQALQELEKKIKQHANGNTV